MTAADVVKKLFLPVDQARIQKAQALAQRQRIPWAEVLAAMTEEQRKQVEDAVS